MRKRSLLLLGTAALAWGAEPRYNLGRPATENEIKRMAISIAPDGANLPPGQGTAIEGEALYARTCEECHGPEGRGGDETGFVGQPRDLTGDSPSKTVGSYWPYATTLFDYIRRAMPFTRPGTLTDEQVYSVTAYLLHLNGLITREENLDAERLRRIRMPNQDGFIPDERPDVNAQ